MTQDKPTSAGEDLPVRIHAFKATGEWFASVAATIPAEIVGGEASAIYDFLVENNLGLKPGALRQYDFVVESWGSSRCYRHLFKATAEEPVLLDETAGEVRAIAEIFDKAADLCGSGSLFEAITLKPERARMIARTLREALDGKMRVQREEWEKTQKQFKRP